nr:MAG: hypothetical protein [Caudoviricetes sp.]
MNQERFEEIKLRAEEIFKNYNERVRENSSYLDNFEVWIASVAFNAGYEECNREYEEDGWV